MAIHDIESPLQPTVALAAAISSNTNTDGAILDTANFEMGLVFYLDVIARTDGAYELQIFESDDSSMAGATQIIAPKLLPTTLSTNSITAPTAAVSQGTILSKIGVYANRRYVRPRIVSTTVTTGATIRVIAVQKGEQTPVPTS